MIIDKKCKKCKYEWVTVWKGEDLRNNNGNRVRITDSCPNCGEVLSLPKK